MTTDVKNDEKKNYTALSTLDKAFDVLLDSDSERVSFNEPGKKQVKDVRFELERRSFWHIYGHTLVVYVIIITLAIGAVCLSVTSHKVYECKVHEEQAFQDSLRRATIIKQEDVQTQENSRFQVISEKLDSLDTHIKTLSIQKKSVQRKTSKKQQ